MGSSFILPLPGQPKEGPDPSFHTPAIPNLVQFGFQGIDPPAAFYIQRDDVLLLEGATQLNGDTITVALRLLLPYQSVSGQPDDAKSGKLTDADLLGPGYVQTIQIQLRVPSALALAQTTIPLTEGYLLSATAISANATTIGQTYARLKINRGGAASPTVNPFTHLFEGYLTQVQPLGWPTGVNVRTADGPGFITQYSAGPVALGTDLSISSNNSGRARLAAFFATLVTSGVAGNRVPSFTITQSFAPLVIYQVQDTVAVPASTTISYSLAPGGTNVRGAGAATGVFVTLPVPAPFYGRNGVTIASVTQALLGGDQWTIVRLVTEEWMDVII